MGKVCLYGFCFSALFFLISPIFIIFPISFSSADYLVFPPPGFSLKWYSNFFFSPDWTKAVWLSFKIGFLVTIFSTTLGTMAAFSFVRGSFKGKQIAYAFAVSPMIIPLITVALGSYFLLANLKLVGSQIGLVCIHTVIAVPLVVIIVSNTLKSFDVTLEKASLITGANHFRTFLLITFPIIKSGIFSAAFFAFLTSFDELIIVLFVGGIRAVTLPRRMWQGLRMEFDPTIAAAACLLVLLSVFVFTVISIVGSISSKKEQ